MPVTFRTTGTVAGPEFFLRHSRRLARVQMPVTCAIIERPDGLLLVDTGWSRAQCAWPERDPGWVSKWMLGMRVRAEDALASQLLSLGYDPGDVRHVVATHLHVDHIGGAKDFPKATVHASTAEWAARSRGRARGYDPGSLEFSDRLALHDLRGPAMLGFPASHDLFDDGSVVLLDARGHTQGSVAVAVRLADRWLIHVGDACMFREDYDESTQGRPTLYARVIAQSVPEQQRTFASIRSAERDHGATIVPSHDPGVFAALPTATDAGFRTAWDSAAKKKQQQGDGGRAGKAAKRPPAETSAARKTAEAASAVTAAPESGESGGTPETPRSPDGAE